MMRIEVFNVGHSSAALVIADNGNLILVDCGHDDEGFRPSLYLPQRWKAVQQLIVSHYDSDHVSDLAALRIRMPIERLLSNPTITVDEVRRLKMKEGPLTTGMSALLEMKSGFGPLIQEADFAGVTVQYFYHSYARFADMNNLSMVCCVRYQDFCILFPGDLERAGWLAHLESPLFRQNLAQTQVLVASHHGRENGYCEEIFQYCAPESVIISDTAKQFDTQENCYARHAKGLIFSRDGRRCVLTTRCDGHITIEKSAGQPYTISTQY
jgi:beta-lactamase superfamily II metal-dependent hydrolase